MQLAYGFKTTIDSYNRAVYENYHGIFLKVSIFQLNKKSCVH